MNIVSDEVLKKKYDQLYQKFVKGNFFWAQRDPQGLKLRQNIHQDVISWFCIAPLVNDEKNLLKMNLKTKLELA